MIKLQKSSASKVFNLIKDSARICLVGHKSPDGDCIGSVMALYEFIKENYNDKEISIGIDGSIPYNLVKFVSSVPLLPKYSGEKYDLTIVLDCSSTDRLGIFENVTNNSLNTICIDHHKTNTNFADINIIDPNISSTGELLYHILKTTDKTINLKMAELVYVAILTDTGKFSYSSTSSDTHLVAADLINIGVNVSKLDNLIYNSKPYNVIKAYTECITDIRYYYNSKLGIARITKENVQRNNIDMNDLEGIVEFIREVKEIEVSCVLKQIDDNHTKVSLRSKDKIDVSDVCVKFNGGGHKRAAGFSIDKSLDDTEKIIINALECCLGEQ